MKNAIRTLEDAEAARDRIVAVLRHQLCWCVHEARSARLVRDRNDKYARAFATGKALEVVLRELGEPGDRMLPSPAGEMPLDSRAESEAREFLGPATADFLLGKRAVQ